ncbi:hypothetical protein GGI21_001660, partial [Coemansia aciculifera]
QNLTQDAAQHVVVQYEPLPAILSIRDAISQQSFYAKVRQLVNGDVDAALQSADLVLEKSLYCGAQEHFYLVTIGMVAMPKSEDGETKVFASTQIPTGVQMVVAEILGLPAVRVVCRVKRMGSGKESRSVLIAAFDALGADANGRDGYVLPFPTFLYLVGAYDQVGEVRKGINALISCLYPEDGYV